MLKLFGMEPGLEFKVAMQEAEKMGARCVPRCSSVLCLCLYACGCVDGVLSRHFVENCSHKSTKIRRPGYLTGVSTRRAAHAAPLKTLFSPKVLLPPNAFPCRVLYGDQDVSHTLRRLSAGLDWQTVSRLMTSSPEGADLGLSDNSDSSSSSGGLSGMEGAVEALKTRAAARRMTQHLRGVAPELAVALVDERDEVRIEPL